MSYVRLILIFLLALLAVLFIVANSTEVQLSLALIPYRTPHLPLWLVVIVAVGVAYCAGHASRFLPIVALRRRLKRAEADLATAQTQLRAVTQQLTTMQLAAIQPPPPPQDG